MFGRWNAKLKRFRALSAGLTLGEHALRQLLYGRHVLQGQAWAPVDSRTQGILDTLERDGIAIVADYWPAERCQAVVDAIDRFSEGLPTRVWQDASGADHRIHGLERVDPAAAEFFFNPWLHGVAEATWGARVCGGFALGARLDAANNNTGSGGLGWHRDGVTQQFKAILYLNDVGAAQGPFQLVRGTRTAQQLTRHIWRSGLVFRQTVFDDAVVARIDATDPGAVTTAMGPAGTLVLAATRNLHRGMPIVSGSRYALTNYYFSATGMAANVADYYNRQVAFADARPLTVADVRAYRPRSA